MMKKLHLFPMIILSLFLIAGCGGGPASTTSHPEVERVLGNFEKAVEAYNVTGMLNCLSDTGFQLTITEAGLSYYKDKTTLITELTNDQTNQLAWRKSNTADPVNGHGYVLDLVLGAPAYSNETSSGIIATQTFAVYESTATPSIPKTKTDNGKIIWQMANTSGTWQAAAMTIEYQTLSGAALSVSGTGNSSGFGFSRFSRLSWK